MKLKSGFDQPRPHGDARELDSALAAELRVNPHAVRLHRLGADGEPRCRLAGGHPGREQTEYLALAWCQRLEAPCTFALRFPHGADDGTSDPRAERGAARDDSPDTVDDLLE